MNARRRISPAWAPWLMLGAAFLFALMGVCVKLASARYGAGEIVMYRGLFGVGFVGACGRAGAAAACARPCRACTPGAALSA